MNRYKATGETRPGMIIPHFSIEAGYLRVAFNASNKAGEHFVASFDDRIVAAKMIGRDLYFFEHTVSKGRNYGSVPGHLGGLTPESVIRAIDSEHAVHGGRNPGDGAIFDNLWKDTFDAAIPQARFFKSYNGATA